jgi:lipopolysaccharide export system permease protein
MLSRFLMYFGFFALVLVLIYWINRAVKLFDQLLANGQNIFVFLEFTALALPLVIALVLPVASFIASIYVANRLTLESELVVAEATGISPFRLARPVFFFGLFTAAFIAVLAHLLVPMSQVRLVERQGEIAQSITTRFLTEGSFVHPARGITVYIRDITRDGEMRDLFLSDARSPKQRITYTAESALVVRTDDGPRLVMFDGLAQVLHEDGRLTTTGFEDLTYDISALMTGPLFLERTPVRRFWPKPSPPAQCSFTRRITAPRRACFPWWWRWSGSRACFSAVSAASGCGGRSCWRLWPWRCSSSSIMRWPMSPDATPRFSGWST